MDASILGSLINTSRVLMALRRFKRRILWCKRNEDSVLTFSIHISGSIDMVEEKSSVNLAWRAPWKLRWRSNSNDWFSVLKTSQTWTGQRRFFTLKKKTLYNYELFSITIVSHQLQFTIGYVILITNKIPFYRFYHLRKNRTI